MGTTMQSILDYSQSLDYLIAFILAATLYLCRLKLKVLYGALEVAFAVYLVELSFKLSGEFDTEFNSDFDVVHLNVGKAAFIGAVFVMVRGFDNIRLGCKCKF